MAGLAEREDVVEIAYKPRNWAKPFHARLTRFAALVLHRRAGKTTALMNHHIRAAMDDDWERARLLRVNAALTRQQLEELVRPPGGRHYGHVMPTRVQAKMVVWDRLKHYASAIPGVKPNESELLLRFPSGHKLQLFGADDPDSLRGFGPSGISFDEFSQQPANIYSEVISKALGDHLGYAIFAGTIKGRDHLYRMYEATCRDGAWFTLWQDIDTSLSTEDGVTIQNLRQAMADDRDQISKGLMTQDEYDQEWYLSADAAIKGAIFGKEIAQARKDNRLTRVPYEPALPVDTDWDLGVGDATAIWFSQSLKTGEVRLIDFYEASGEGLPHYAQVLQNKGYSYGRHYAPHDIAVRELGSGKSRLETAAGFGLRFEVTPRIHGVAGVEVEEGINAARLLLPRCYFDAEKCAKGLEALMHYRRDYNTRLDEFKATPVHDWASHAADAFRGLAVRHQVPRQVQAEQVFKPQPYTLGQEQTAWMG